MLVSIVVTRALRMAHALRPGQGASATDLADGGAILASMLDGWNAESLMIFTITRNTGLTLTAGKLTYKIGPTSVGDPTDLNIVRPPRIDRAGFINPGSSPEVEFGLEGPLSDEDWQGVMNKTLSASLPFRFYDDCGMPYRTLQFHPVPNQTISAVLYFWSALPTTLTSSTDLILPPGYQEALISNLAVQVDMEWSKVERKPLDPKVVLMAIDTKRRLKAFNVEVPKLRCDPALKGRRGQYNILQDN